MDYTNHPHLEFRRKFFKIVGAEITVSDSDTNETVGFIKMKAFKLKEDVRLYADASMDTELLIIKARSIIDFGATYDVTDPMNGELICSLRRKGLRSTFVRDKWEILNSGGDVIGMILETSGALAIVRRYVGAINELLELVFAFVPETFRVVALADGTEVQTATVVHRKNPLVVKMTMDASMRPSTVDPRINVAATTMLAIIDANKN